MLGYGTYLVRMTRESLLIGNSVIFGEPYCH